MGDFIKLHVYRDTPILLNINAVETVEPRENGTRITLRRRDGSIAGHGSVNVMEDFDDVTSMVGSCSGGVPESRKWRK